MKKPVVITITLTGVAAIVAAAIVFLQQRRERKRQEIQRVADAIQQYSTGSGWSFPAPLDTIIHSNIVMDAGTVEVKSEVVVHEPTPLDLQEEERRRVQRMTLIDDRTGQEATEQTSAGDVLKAAPEK